ncbi:hypothetical protein HDK77DRAFT_315737 [Phyllosticta capitalensis]
MSLSPAFQSSPLSASGDGRSRKSQFTFKQLAQLGSYSTSTPLRVIAHIDLDAFYAQCEMVRLGVPAEQPLAVQQWQGLIAINYPARAFGLNRHITSAEAQKLCPDLIMQHVATWKEGEATWAYHEDSFKNMGSHKVSLDPYRSQSRKILALIKESLPADAQRVEKASIDEVFMDLSAHVHRVLLERYSELRGPPPYDDPTEHLPRPPTAALDWQTDHLIDLDSQQTEDDDPDWDDIALLVASEIVRDVRAAIFAKLKYTCSAGIARNKMLAKLGSGYKKPNQQTVVRNRAVHRFLGDMKFTKIRNLGGKLGDEVVAMFNTDLVKELLEVPLEQLKKLGDETGQWLYNTARGIDSSEVNPRIQIKSMLSAKSFRPSIDSMEQAVRWIRIFCADIFSRCVEEGVLENRRRPKTINLHHRQGMKTRSKQAPIPAGKAFSEEMLFNLAKNLLAQVVVDGRAWPCSNLSLSVGGFEDGITNNKGIGGFLVRGAEAKAMKESAAPQPGQIIRMKSSDAKRNKRRKLEAKAPSGLVSFLQPMNASSRQDSNGGSSSSMSRETSHTEPQDEDVPVDPFQHDDAITDDPADNPNFVPDELLPSDWAPSPRSPSPIDSFAEDLRCGDEPSPHPVDFEQSTTSRNHIHDGDPFPPDPLPPSAQPPPKDSSSPSPEPADTVTATSSPCPRCNNKPIPLAELAEHHDWHFAKDLAREMQAEEQRNSASASASAPAASSSSSPAPAPAPSSRPPAKPAARGRGRPPGAANRAKEKGQMKLAFGKG